MLKTFLTMILSYWVYILLFIWQLPQTILGILWLNINLIFYYGIKHIATIGNSVYVYQIPTKLESVSLGKYIVVSEDVTPETIYHEYGHCKQSKILGWLYIPVIAIPSLIWAGIYQWTNKPYEWFYTERWANKLVNNN